MFCRSYESLKRTSGNAKENFGKFKHIFIFHLENLLMILQKFQELDYFSTIRNIFLPRLINVTEYILKPEPFSLCILSETKIVVFLNYNGRALLARI